MPNKHFLRCTVYKFNIISQEKSSSILMGPLLCFMCGYWRNKLWAEHGIAWVLWHRSIAWNPTVLQVRAPKSYFPKCASTVLTGRLYTSAFSTLRRAAVPRRQSTHTSHARSHPPHALYLVVVGVCCFVLFIYFLSFWAPSHLRPSVFLRSLSFFFFFDWLDSTLISMSHYLLEYSGECFQLLPLQLL